MAPVQLPYALRGYIRYVVVLSPEDNLEYSIGIKYIYLTTGAKDLLGSLKRNAERKHKKHIQSWLCVSVIQGECCPLKQNCPNIHVSLKGFESRRVWNRLTEVSEERQLLVHDPYSLNGMIPVPYYTK
eukprot:NODE_6824_length_839_cov_34.994413_g6225_i0.p1 GENE.NODE_6824_length_839_cov_34.994413_g6225_i0~~NODE_6824_length_839_cov_34.994413_g6225_i0.p1  ORF type:complete len:146 (+),score=18.48 NODE_6824_length_839_cov_34.994413_g6225_i0:55-438(+)